MNLNTNCNAVRSLTSPPGIGVSNAMIMPGNIDEKDMIKNISNEVAGKADILLVPNLETGNSLSKIMVYFMGACAAGFIVGGKVPVVVTSRADSSASRIASIAAAVIATQ